MKKGSRWIYFLVIAGFLLTVQWGSRAVTTIAESQPVLRTHCIVIDPGHGGVDGGAISCTGKPESGYNLEISLRLADLFRLLGYEVKLLRQTDISVHTKGETIAQKKISDLKERVRMVNETENAILLSIHQNQFSDSRYSGAQVFYGSHPDSEALAQKLQEGFVTALNPGSRRKCKKSSGVYLMEHIDCPGVLIECGFLSNPEEAEKLRAGEYQKKICATIASQVSIFLSNT